MVVREREGEDGGASWRREPVERHLMTGRSEGQGSREESPTKKLYSTVELGKGQWREEGASGLRFRLGPGRPLAGSILVGITGLELGWR